MLPVAVSWMASIDTPQTRYSSGMLAVMHSAQYLWITRYFAKRDAEQAARAGGWSPWRYWATLVAGGAALFLPIPWLASYGWHVDFTASIFIVAAIVNLHHFMIDGVVWKLRNPRVGRVLVQADAAAADAAPAATARRPRMPRQDGARRSRGPGGRHSSRRSPSSPRSISGATSWPSATASATGWRKRRGSTRTTAAPTCAWPRSRARPAIRRPPRPRCGAPSTSTRRTRVLAQALVRRLIEASQFDEAYRQCQAMLARWPDDVNALVNAGVLADRLGDAAAAERWWTQAVARDPSQRRVHLYLAERLDARGATRDALSHYRRYLELAARAAADDRPDPREVVAIVVKFGDALARDGQVDTARRSTIWRSGWPARPGWPTSARSPPIERRALDAPGPRLR